MPTSYTGNNGLALPATGELANSWGDTVNNEITSLVDQSLDGIATIAISGTTHTLSISDGALSDGRNRILIFTGSLAANNTVTITPNDAKKWYAVINNTTGGFSVIIKQGSGSGSTVSVSMGYGKMVQVDGTGTNANVTELIPNPAFGGNVDVSGAFGATGQATFGANASASGVLVNSGSAASPSFTFKTDTNTGIYSSAANTVAVSTDGVLRTTIDVTGLSQDGILQSSSSGIAMRLQAGAFGASAVGSTSDHDVIVFRNSVNVFQFQTGGAIASPTGASLSAGGTWTNASDVALKHGFKPVSTFDILRGVSALPITSWQYKAETGVPHIGPTAQDFKTAFGLGGDDKGISTVDAIGVLFAAVQELSAQVNRPWWKKLKWW